MDDLSAFYKAKTVFEGSQLPSNVGTFIKERAVELNDRTLGNWFEDSRTLTYRELDLAADKLASSLLRIGVRKGTHIAVMLPSTAEFLIVWVAVARLGAVIVPVNNSYTSDELLYVLGDSDAQFLIVDQSFVEVFERISNRLPLIAPHRVIVYGDPVNKYPRYEEMVLNGDPDFVSPFSVSRDDLLCIQYTSGTTGFPKGCMLTHDYWLLIGHNAAIFRQTNGRAIERMLIWAPFYYMDAIWQFLMAVKLGATAYFPRRYSLSRFYEWLNEYRINYCNFPEVAYRQMPGWVKPEHIHLVHIGAYYWSTENRMDVQQRFNVVAREAFGMTESGTCLIVPTEATHKSYTPTCGIEAAFRRVRLVDDSGNDVPRGEVGEMTVTGRGMFWGYYKKPEENADRFRGVWFRTGDLARQDEDGFYHIVGRIKDMIKRSGENIAAQEVEATLRKHDGIAEAAVVAVPDELRKEEVKAYIMLKDGLTPESVAPGDIIEHCRKTLAPFKVPRYVTYVDDFPRSPTRKIRKGELVKGVTDLRVGSWDRESKSWIHDS